MAPAVAGEAVSAVAGEALATTAGCGKAPTLKSGTYSIQVNGKSRTYILKIPDNYNNSRAYRLVFGFHWLGGNATDVANGQMVKPYYGLQALANNSTIFVAPQGLADGMGTGWPNTGGQDVAFVDSMVQQIETGLCVDTTQLFSLGFSYGGGMSYALACARAKVFRAVAIYSGGLISECKGGTDPIAYLQAHGLGDQVLPIASARTMRDKFAKNNGCTAANPPEPASGSRRHISTAYSGCSAGHPVVWAAFDGGTPPFRPTRTVPNGFRKRRGSSLRSSSPPLRRLSSSLIGTTYPASATPTPVGKRRSAVWSWNGSQGYVPGPIQARSRSGHWASANIHLVCGA